MTNEGPTFAPFVVFGSSKSGTTWLQKMLDAHPEIRCHFQLLIFPLNDRELWHPLPIVYRDRTRSPFGGVFEHKEDEDLYNLMLKFTNKMAILDRDFVESIGPLYIEHGDALRALQHRILRATTEILLRDTEEKSIFGTKAYTDLGLLFDVFPNAKLIHIVRDGRDVCVSKQFHFNRMKLFFEGDERTSLLRLLNHLFNRHRYTRAVRYRLQYRFGWFGERWYRDVSECERLFTPKALTKLATDWKLIVRYLLDYQQMYPVNTITMRYEDLLTKPHTHIRTLLDFLGADASTAIVDNIIEKTKFENLQSKSDNNFFRKGKSGDWRNYFTSQDVALFKEVTSDMLLELKYETDHNWSL